MFQSFTFKNFRCFRDFKLDSLARINLIAGQNNVGKTALLEGIFLHLGPTNPGLSEILRGMRGIQRAGIRSAEDVWGDLFPAYNLDAIIELASEDRSGVYRFLHMSLKEPEHTRFIQPETDAEKMVALGITKLPDREFILEYRDSTGQEAVSSALVTDAIRSDKIGKVADLPLIRLIATSTRRVETTLFSDLEAVGRESEVISALKLIEPRLKRLALLSTGGTSIIHADLGIGRLIPIPLVGEGMNRLLTITVAIANTEHGVVLIDEIENGLHYSVMTKVWTAIAQAARAADVQIFATTHSWECITAAHEAFSSSAEYDFRLHRLDRVGEDIQAVTLDQEMLDTAIKTGLEVR